MTAFTAAPILQSAPTVIAIWRVSGVEEAGVLASAGARWSRQWRSCLAVWCAALLALALPAQAPWPDVALSPPGTSIDSLASRDQSLESPVQPTSGLRPAQPSALGVVARSSLLDKTPALSPARSPRCGSGTDHDLVLASGASGAFDGETRQILHRSSIGTARAPTGPPL